MINLILNLNHDQSHSQPQPEAEAPTNDIYRQLFFSNSNNFL